MRHTRACWIVTLRGRLAALEAEAAGTEAEAAQMRAEAEAVRQGLDPREVEAITAAATEANAIIDGRTFSWSDLFTHFETTLPEDVRIVSVSPRVERDGRMLMAIVVVGRRAEDIDRFVQQLEDAGAFRNLLSSQEAVNEDGLLETVLEGEYLRPAPARGVEGRP